MIRFTKVPPAPQASSALCRSVEDDDVAAVRVAEVVDEAVREDGSSSSRGQPGCGSAQCSVCSIDEDGIRYGFTIHALIASTAPTATTMA